RAAAIAGFKAKPDPAHARVLPTLYKRRLPERVGDPALDPLISALAAAFERVASCEHEVKSAHQHATLAASQHLRVVAADDRFRQAMLWQNRAAVHNGVDVLLRRPVGATDEKTRSHERLVASYVQRYCAKNDTIGFFGPMGWAQFGASDRAFTQNPGPGLISRATVYFEYWAIDALATKLSAELEPKVPPRLLPQFRLDGNVLHMPVDRTSELPDEFATVAKLCDGRHVPDEIARELGRDVPDILETLGELRDSKIIHWELEVPTMGHRPEHMLATSLERIGATTKPLVELETLRDAVAAAATAPALDDALHAFATGFTALTGASDERAHGQMYAARTPLYQECQRDLEVELGTPLVTRLAQPLALVLASARWYTYEIARRYREAFDPLVEVESVSWHAFWSRAIRLFPGGNAPDSIVHQVRTELRQRWGEILAVRDDERVVRRTSAELAPRVHAAFAAPCPGWPSARHQSPDILFTADGTPVLGELHTGFNTVTIPAFVKEHRTPAELIAARDRDLGARTIGQVWSKAVTAADAFSPSANDYDFEAGTTVSPRPRDHVVVPSECHVVRRDGHLVVTSPQLELDIIAFVEQHLIAESFAHFSFVDGGGHGPRISIDDLVIQRESWKLAPDAFAWASLKTPVERYTAGRRWAKELGMPRWVFVRTPEEVKPMYVDFASTMYVEMVAKQLRAASHATVSEMLPTIADAWVTDAAGELYTSELRIATLDPT
ncbi:MAG TPA: lantibiotic dehydratase, partial [Kofleriaceae bacterium]